MKLLNYLGWGIAHERQGIPCQDVIGYATHENGNVVAVLSDGAGGAAWAREAAQANVDGVLEYFRDTSAARFREMEQAAAARELLEACVTRLRQLALDLGGCRSSDLSATLLFALWDGCVLTLGHLGDGMLLALDTSGNRSLFSPPEHPAGDNRGSWFTVSPMAEAHLRLYHLDADRAGAFLMTSDGAYGMLRDRGGAAEAAGVLAELARSGEIHTSQHLAELMYQIAPRPEERLDDWSFFIGCPGVEIRSDALQPPVSMLREERKRIREITEVTGCEHPT
jgi:hypothetical protein